MIDPFTQIYCIFGNPVQHSKSPLIHNRLFQHYQMNAVYLAFGVDEISEGIQAMRSLNIKGASITLPFKTAVMRYLDWIDKDALNIGAVNTIVNEKGKLLGYNTDFKAAVTPLKPFGIQNREICIIGAGGAAHAVAYGISKEKGKLIIVNRDQKKGGKLAHKYQAKFIPLDQIKTDKIKAEVIINTTAIGMHPDTEKSAVPSFQLSPGMMVMDIVYTPVNTRLLRTAKKNGCTTIDGLSMFISQAEAQFKLWTHLSPDRRLMHHLFENKEN